MAVRETHPVNDIRDCVYKLLKQYKADTSPWSDWDVISGWPSTELTTAEKKKIVYVMEPVKVAEMGQQGGKLRHGWELTVGFWLTRNAGGSNEMGIWEGRMIYTFGDPQAIHSKTFTVTLGSTPYADTTLKAQGIAIQGLVGPGPNLSEDTDKREFRKEAKIQLIA